MLSLTIPIILVGLLRSRTLLKIATAKPRFVQKRKGYTHQESNNRNAIDLKRVAEKSAYETVEKK